MKTKLTTLIVALFLMTGITTLNAQISEECITTGSIFTESAKVKNWDAAKPAFEKLRNNCPNWSLALYQYGERLIKADLKKATGAEKTAIAQDLIAFLKQREQYFPAKTPKGENAADQAQILFDNKIGTTKSQFDAFDAAWKMDKASIKSPKSIYTYFKLAVELNKNNQYDLQDIFDLYDDVQNKMNEESTKLSGKLQPLLDKEEAGQKLSAKEAKRKKGYGTNLRAFGVFAGSVDSTLGQLADCPNLIQLYNKDFNAKQNDIDWIRKAAGRMAGKDCTDDPLFVQLVEQLHKLEPSAKSAQYLGILEDKRGNSAAAESYFQQAIDLELDPKEKAKSYYRLAEKSRKKGSYGKARGLYNKALAEDPSMGRCYLKIAAMYASSANNCGDSVFDKRAVYWLAASTAERAGRVSPSLAKTANGTAASYRGKAPDKSMIFTNNKGGQTIKIGCWIGSSVRVPSL